MPTHKCDFCQDEICSAQNEVTAVISYLPCFHAICQRCKSNRFRVSDPLTCVVCNCPSFQAEVFDLELPDPNKIYCPTCSEKNRERVEFCCQSCNNAFFCTRCIVHHETAKHAINRVKHEILPRSQCTVHGSSQAIAICSCQLRLCDECYVMHGTENPGHLRKTFSSVADVSRQKLNALMYVTRQDSGTLQKTLPVLHRHKAAVHETASKARTAVASEIVELCNALMRRGNDIVMAIDMAEDTKLKSLTKFESEVKFAQDKLKKIEFFIDMALHTVPPDLPGTVSANVFAECAYALFNEKRKHMQPSIESLQRLPLIKYLSDLPPILNCFSALGQLDVDGVVKTPQSSTPQTARIFLVTNGGTPQTSGALATQRNLNRTNAVPLSSATAQQLSTTQHNDLTNPVISVTNTPSVSGIGAHSGFMKHSNVSPSVSRPSNIVTPMVNMQAAHPGGGPHQFLPGNPFVNHCIPPQIMQPQHLQMQRSVAAQHQQHQNCLLNSPCSSTSTAGSCAVQASLMAANVNAHHQAAVAAAAAHQRHMMAAAAAAAIPPYIHPSHQQQQHQAAMAAAAAAAVSSRYRLLPHHQQQQTSSAIIQQQHQQFLQQQQQQRNAQLQSGAAALGKGLNNPGGSSRQLSPRLAVRSPPWFSSTAAAGSRGMLVSGTSEAAIKNPVLAAQLQNSHNQQYVSPSVSHLQQKTKVKAFDNPAFFDFTDQQQLLSKENEANAQKDKTEKLAQKIQPSLPVMPDSTIQIPSTLKLPQPIEHIVSSSESVLAKLVKEGSVCNAVTTKRPTSANNTSQAVKNEAKRPRFADLLNEPDEIEMQANVNNEENETLPKKVICQINDIATVRNNSPSVTKMSDNAVNENDATTSEKILPPAIGLAPKIILKKKNDTYAADIINLDNSKKMDMNFDIVNLKNQSRADEPKQQILEFENVNDEKHKDHVSGESTKENNSGTRFELNRNNNREEIEDANKLNDVKFRLNGDQMSITTAVNSPMPSSSNSDKKVISTIAVCDNTGIERELDTWDDYCFVCNQGCDNTTGDLGCCAACPHVFHNKCHIPAIQVQMSELPDDWKCSCCLYCEILTTQSTHFDKREKLLCSKVLLACFKAKPDVEPFYREVPRNVTMYYDVIKKPMSMYIIAEKLSADCYENVEQFIADMNLLFRNCSLFNAPSGPIALSGRSVYALYRDAVREYLPYYANNVWIYVSLRNDDENCLTLQRRNVVLKRSTKRESSVTKSAMLG